MTACRAGIDFGGTATRFVILGPSGPLATRLTATAALAEGSPEARLDRVAETLRALLPGGFTLQALGIGATGPVDRATGIVHNADTLPGFSGFPVVAGLQARLAVPVVIDNDAVAAAVGEWQRGAGHGASRLLMVTLGTGIGAALLIDGQPFRGAAGAHPEGGHITISGNGERCYCGAAGCWEPLASRAALQALLRPLLPPVVAERDLIAEAMARCATPAIAAAFAVYGERVGRGLAVLHTLYMPEVTVLGGSAAAALPLFAAGVQRALSRAPGFGVSTDLRRAALGDAAGAIGAALLATDPGSAAGSPDRGW